MNNERPQNSAEALPTPQQLAQLRDERWVQAALAGELEKLAHLPDGENINRADSQFFIALLKIAALVKGTGRTYLSPQQVLLDIKQICGQYPFLKEKELERQWQNAYNRANPRYRRA